MPKKYTCDGDDVNPPLIFEDVPRGTKSLALFLIDPDVSEGENVCWTVWNIPSGTGEIEKNDVPDEAVEGITDSGKPGYHGPCHEAGMHAYLFKLYALDIILPAESGLHKRDVRKMMEGHILEKAMLKCFYERQHSENF